MDAGSSNFSVNDFYEIMVWHPCVDECVEPLEHFVGIHVGFKFGQICRDSFLILTGEALRRGSESGDSRCEEGSNIKVKV